MKFTVHSSTEFRQGDGGEATKAIRRDRVKSSRGSLAALSVSSP